MHGNVNSKLITWIHKFRAGGKQYDHFMDSFANCTMINTGAPQGCESQKLFIPNADLLYNFLWVPYAWHPFFAIVQNGQISKFTTCGHVVYYFISF